MTRIVSIVLLLLALPLHAAQAPASLILNIVVEGLDEHYIALTRPLMNPGGMARLTGLEATSISHIDYGSHLDPVAAATMLLTGASPMVNGVPSAWVYNPEINQVSPIFKDTKALGNFTDETLSPSAIKVSTLVDELRVATGGQGKAIAIAADPQVSLALAGHAADCAYWIYDRTGNWASSSYFGDMPSVLSNRNYRNSLSSRLDTMRWTPLLNPAIYPTLSPASTGFSHNFPKKMAHRTAAFKATPLANREVTDVAIDLIKSLNMGTDATPDIVNIAYSLAPKGASEIEMLDTYLRLDRDLARLFSEANRVAGRSGVAIILTGIPAASTTTAPDAPIYRIPTGEYSIKKAISLLNMYLIAMHGNGNWILGVYDCQFFLNHKLITDSNLSLTVFRQEVADFLARMAGVGNVYTIDDIIASRAGENPQALKRNTSIEHCGDVIIEVIPGWMVVDDPFGGLTDNGIVRCAAPSHPAYLLIPGCSPRAIETPVDARALAPYLSRLINIRPPAAAATATLH